MARVRTDVALTVAVAALVGLGAQKITTTVIEKNNRPIEYMAVEITDGTIGAQAGGDTPRMETIAEIKTQKGLFTIELDNHYQYEPIPTTDDYYCVKLDNGEYLIARILRDSVTTRTVDVSSYYRSSLYVLPIGETVNKPVPQSVLDLAERYYHLPEDDSFYVDMRGTHKSGTLYKPRDAKAWGENVFILTTLVLTVVLWRLMVRLGLFPPLLPRRAKRNGTEAR